MPEESAPNEVCAKCGFNLVGLSDTHCRKCGHEFSPGEYSRPVPFPWFLAFALGPVHLLGRFAIGSLYVAQKAAQGPFEEVLHALLYVLDKPGGWFYVIVNDPNQLVSLIGTLLFTAPVFICNSILWGFMLALMIWRVRIMLNRRRLRAEIEAHQKAESP